MEVLERFLKYIDYNTTSDQNPENKNVPTTVGQKYLAEDLMKELNEMGVTDVEMDDMCFIYGHIPSNLGDKEVPTLGFVSHMDTSPEAPAPEGQARVVRNYDGGVIELCEDVILDPDDESRLKVFVGDDLVVTNGKTLLGGDDKCGVAEIMTAIEFMMTHPEFKHGRIAFAFTPDEEIGGSMRNFNVEKFDSDFAYTVDAEDFGEIEYENFGSGACEIEIEGFAVHPGYAKNIMKNALVIANEFHNMMPAWDRPEHSEGRDGFYHLVIMEGSPKHSKMAYLIKDFEVEGYNKRKERVEEIADYINKRYGEGTVTLKFTDGRMNMAPLMAPHMHLVERVIEEVSEMGYEPKKTLIRGGTDGVAMTYKGIPCPNIGTGSYNHHSVKEYANVREMQLCYELILRLISRYSNGIE